MDHLGNGCLTAEPTIDDVMRSRALLMDGARSRFLELLEPSIQERIFELTASSARDLHRWAQRYPVIRQVRIVPLCLSVAAAAPFISTDALTTTARVSLWVFTLDDLFDEGDLSYANLIRCAERYGRIAFGRREGNSGDSLADALCEVRDDLERYPLFGSLSEEWAKALCGTIDGMVREYCWRLACERGQLATLPSYKEYVANGLYSIGGPPHIWAAIITANDHSTPRHLDHLRQMERIASTCVRLANDLQSHAREVAEHNINSLVILSEAFRQSGVPEDEADRQAEAFVLDHIAQGLVNLEELMERAQTKSGRPEAAIADIARFVCEFYSRHDYHTFVAKEVQANVAYS